MARWKVRILLGSFLFLCLSVVYGPFLGQPHSFEGDAAGFSIDDPIMDDAAMEARRQQAVYTYVVSSLGMCQREHFYDDREWGQTARDISKDYRARNKKPGQDLRQKIKAYTKLDMPTSTIGMLWYSLTGQMQRDAKRTLSMSLHALETPYGDPITFAGCHKLMSAVSARRYDYDLDRLDREKRP